MFASFLARADARQNEQLLKLYWNRASVKRELSALKRERFELLDKLKEQEHAIVRAQEQFEGLERLLTNPLAAANAMVYFQLRHLWRVAAQRLEALGAELQLQREKRELAQVQDAALAKRRRRLNAIGERVQSLLHKRKHVIEELYRLEQRLQRGNVLVRLMRGPRLRRRTAALHRARAILDEKLQEFNELTDKIEGEPLPELEELSFTSRRLINIGVIALAQHLVVHFSTHDLAKLARESVERSVAEMKFGDRRDCDLMVERIRERIIELSKQQEVSEQVKRRADRLVAQVQYRNETDTVPSHDSLDSIELRTDAEAPNAGRRASDAPLRINVLRDSYWDVDSVLR